MAVAIRAHSKPLRASLRLVMLRWVLRGAGLLGCAAAIAATPEFVSQGGAPLRAPGLEALLVYRWLALIAGVCLLVLAEVLRRLSERRERLLEPLGIALPLAALSICVALKAVLGPEHTVYASLVGEDGVVEYATCALYFSAGCLAVGVARGLRRQDERLLAGLWVGFAVALVIVSLEEISWGQRLFGVPTPALLESNVQHEMTLHNMPLIHHFLPVAYLTVGLFGSFAWALFAGRGPARIRVLVCWLVPRSSLVACFLPVALVYALLEFTPARWVGADGLRFGFVSTYDQEPAELLLSLGFLLFAVHATARLQGWLRESDRGR